MPLMVPRMVLNAFLEFLRCWVAALEILTCWVTCCLLLIFVFKILSLEFGLRSGSSSVSPGLEVIKLEYSLRLKIKRNDWLLADT